MAWFSITTQNIFTIVHSVHVERHSNADKSTEASQVHRKSGSSTGLAVGSLSVGEVGFRQITDRSQSSVTSKFGLLTEIQGQYQKRAMLRTTVKPEYIVLTVPYRGV